MCWVFSNFAQKVLIKNFIKHLFLSAKAQWCDECEFFIVD